jgi:hypothetical protein
LSFHTLRRADQREIARASPYRDDFLFAFFPGIIFLAARFVVFAADLAAFFTVRTARETTDFFFALLAIVISRFSIWIF